MDKHKKKPMNFRGVEENRFVRSFNRRDERNNAKHVRLSCRRNIDPEQTAEDTIIGGCVENVENVPIVKIPETGKSQSRLEMLKKWKEEKVLKKKLEASKKPMPFKVSAVTYKPPAVLAASNIPTAKMNVTKIPGLQSTFKKPLPVYRAQPSRHCKVPSAKPVAKAVTVQQRNTSSSLVRSNTFIKQGASVPASKVPSVGKFADNRPKTGTKRGLSFAPKTVSFVAPKNLKTFDLKPSNQQSSQKSFTNLFSQGSRFQRPITNTVKAQTAGKPGSKLPIPAQKNKLDKTVRGNVGSFRPKILASDMSGISILRSPTFEEKVNSLFSAQKAKVLEASMHVSTIGFKPPVEIKEQAQHESPIAAVDPVQNEDITSVPVVAKHEELEAAESVLEPVAVSEDGSPKAAVEPVEKEDITLVPVVAKPEELEEATKSVQESAVSEDSNRKESSKEQELQYSEVDKPLEAIDEGVADATPKSKRKRKRLVLNTPTPRIRTRNQQKLSLLGSPMILRSSIKGDLISFSPSVE